MNDVIRLATALGHPCIHVVYFCGNTFPVKCDKCGTYKMVTCTKSNNTHLKGQFDVIGIAWAIETKHKVNKGPQTPKLSISQQAVEQVYKTYGIPCLCANEGTTDEVVKFLNALPH